MRRPGTFARLSLAMLCLSLLATQMAGAHLHLCLDRNGSEPAVSVHLNDGGIHHLEANAGSGHHDVDVSLTGEGLSKKSDGHTSLPALMSAAWLPLQAPSRDAIRVAHQHTSPAEPLSRFYILPPLRAPPV